MSDGANSNVVDLRPRFEERQRAHIREQRGWRTRIVRGGDSDVHVRLILRGGESIDMTPAQARELSRMLASMSVVAEAHRDRMSGVVHMLWCRPDGTPLQQSHRPHTQGHVRARIIDRTTASIRVQPERPIAEPPHSEWYDAETGIPHDLPPGRRHWRVREVPLPRTWGTP